MGGCCWSASAVYGPCHLLHPRSKAIENLAVVDSASAVSCGVHWNESFLPDRYKSRRQITCRYRDRRNGIALRSAPRSREHPAL